MMGKAKTFEERLAEVFSDQSPFTTIEEYTEWYLSRKALDLTNDAVLLEETYRRITSPFREVPLHTLERKAVDIIAVVESEISDFGNWVSVDTDQFLVIGQDEEMGYDVVRYKQGYARAI